MVKPTKTSAEAFERVFGDLNQHAENTKNTSLWSVIATLQMLAELEEIHGFFKGIDNYKGISPYIQEMMRSHSSVYAESNLREVSFEILCKRLDIPKGFGTAHRWMMVGKKLAEKEPEFRAIKPKKTKRKMYFQLIEFQLAEYKDTMPIFDKISDTNFCKMIIAAKKRKEASPEFKKLFRGSLDTLTKNISKGRHYFRMHKFLLHQKMPGIQEIHDEVFGDILPWQQELLEFYYNGLKEHLSQNHFKK